MQILEAKHFELSEKNISYLIAIFRMSAEIESLRPRVQGLSSAEN